MLIKCFKEREEIVRTDVFVAFRNYVRQPSRRSTTRTRCCCVRQAMSRAGGWAQLGCLQVRIAHATDKPMSTLLASDEIDFDSMDVDGVRTAQHLEAALQTRAHPPVHSRAPTPAHARTQCKHAHTQARTRSHADTQSAQPGRPVSSGDKVIEFTSEDVSKVVKAVLRQLVNQKSVKTRERSVVDGPTSAPRPAHICPGATRPTSSLGPRLGCIHGRTATAPVSAAANAEERHFLRDGDRRRLWRDTLKCELRALIRGIIEGTSTAKARH